MKKSILVVIVILLIAIIGTVIIVKISNNKTSGEDNPVVAEKVKLSNTEGINTVLTLEDEIETDTIWCGTFQLIWNDLKNDLAKKDIVFYDYPDLQVVKNLNKETFTTKDISEQYYYKKIGVPSLELKEEIENAIKEKFNETSDILNDFNWNFDNDGLEKYFLYAMLKKEFQFEKEFEELDKGKFGKFKDVNYFGIKDNDSREITNQVRVLYYNSKNDFAVKLITKQEDEVILCKNPNGNTFNEIYENIKNAESTYNGNKKLEEGEILKIPNIKLKEKIEFNDLENKSFYFSNNKSYHIDKAMQTIEFELNKTGGKVKSEAGMMILEESIAIMPEEKREFLLDDTFAIYLTEEGKDNPYFAAVINDITKFQ